MSENAEATEAKVAKKRPAKKAAKKTARKAAAKKAPAKRVAKKAEAAAPAKRGRPAGKKTAARKVGVRRGKKGAKQFAYLLLTAQEDGSQKASTMNGPFATEGNALDDASIMADDNTTIVLFRETKRGRVQKQTKFVAGR
ncbi:hypothetical protein Salvo_25 [Xylella phage Salvo]|uniref:Uncharacterized protein n=1 Tax=Xylella phage Salvo TaxID=1415147 RepID=V5Q9U6_9CAUD|nr:hypothetical protein FGG49_gp25 [Xylella phage Salvo]AHB12225.1 hypothetical protein Salvo_25 [Xylella phage Salvo]